MKRKSAVAIFGKLKDVGKYSWQTLLGVIGTKLQRATRKGHDPCLADLPGVVNACCGHGFMGGYATLHNGFCLRAKRLIVYLKKVGRLQHFVEIAGHRLKIGRA